MPDVELLDLRDWGDRFDILVGETVAGVHREPDLLRVRSGTLQFLQCGFAAPPAVGVATRMQFDGENAELLRHVDRLQRLNRID